MNNFAIEAIEASNIETFQQVLYETMCKYKYYKNINVQYQFGNKQTSHGVENCYSAVIIAKEKRLNG